MQASSSSITPSYRKENNKGTTGVLLVDNLGLPIESQGNFDKSQSGLISSIMKNAAKLESILGQSQTTTPEETPNSNSGKSQDCMAKIYFKNEQLVIRNKNGMTLALRQEV